MVMTVSFLMPSCAEMCGSGVIYTKIRHDKKPKCGQWPLETGAEKFMGRGREGQEMTEISKSQALKHYAQKSALILLRTQMGDGERRIRGSCVWNRKS